MIHIMNNKVSKNFWQKLKKPFFALAPMSGVTDQSCRLMFAKYGKPDIFWTEFISASALFSTNKNAQKYCLDVLKFSRKERPIVAQIFGSNPAQIEKACQIITELGFDGIDINMGCPDRNVEKQGAGSALIKNPKLAQEIIRSAKKGSAGLPISVKTRIGYNKNELETWIPILLQENISALTVHFRTKAQGYIASANWELAKDLVRLRDKYSPQTLLLGNGDIRSLEQAKDFAAKYNLDGIMVGRGALGNPWFFAGKTPTLKQKLKVILEHAELLPATKHFDSIKKHFHAYTKNFHDCKDLKDALMKSKNSKQVKEIIKKFINNL